MNKLTKLRIKLIQKRSIRLLERAGRLFKKAEELDPETKKANDEATEASWKRFEERMIKEGYFEKE